MKIVLIKIASIGDVAMACRTVNEFLLNFQFPSNTELHWIIDQNLHSLAIKLLHPQNKIKIYWHTIESKKLFQGSFFEKIKSAVTLSKIVAQLRPKAVLLLHRDWKYKLFLLPVFKGLFFSINRNKINELDAYKNVFRAFKNKLNLSPDLHSPTLKDFYSNPTNTIGILIGGGQNTKIIYREKRWPHIETFIELILKQTDKNISLFGGTEDIPFANKIIEQVASPDRISNYVGRTNLPELPTLLSTLDTFVSVDSGLAHIAANCMVQPHQKIISLFGPTDPTIWSAQASGKTHLSIIYKNLPCSPCYNNDGKFKPCIYTNENFQQCMKKITPDEILNTILY